ncbi:MAG: ATP-binding protein [Chloroherpetonaceae bacterium]|nr:ATP-binding protein [Chloroherpetonaceae bacterium]
MILLLWPEARAQDIKIKFEHLGVEQGLPSESIYAIFQDQVGYLWFGTANGLSKYDGYTFSNYSFNPNPRHSLLGKGVRTLYQDRKGRLWIGTWANAGLSCFDLQTETFTHYQHQPDNPESLTSGAVTAVTQDSSGMLWVGTLTGLNRFNPETGIAERYTHNPNDSASLSSNRITALAVGNGHTLWVGTDNGLNQLDLHHGTLIRYYHQSEDSRSLSSNHIRSLYFAPNGTLWVGTDRGLNALVETDTGAYITRYDFKQRNAFGTTTSLIINALCPDNHGGLWLGTQSHGLGYFRPAENRLLLFLPESDNPYSLSDAEVEAVFQDRSGVVWVGVANGKLNKFYAAAVHFGTLALPSGTRTAIESILETQDGTLWIGTVGSGLYQHSPHTKAWKQYRKGAFGQDSELSSNMILSLYQDRKGRLWIGTWGSGLVLYDAASKRFRTFRHHSSDSLKDNFIATICEDAQGNLWVGTWNGLKKFNPETQTFVRFAHPQESSKSNAYRKVRMLRLSRNGWLWVGFEEDGLACFNPATEQYVEIARSSAPLPKIIRSIYEDSTGVVWIGTYDGGLLRFDPSAQSDTARFKHFTTRDGLPSHHIFGILPDASGHLWLGTSNGLCRFHRTTFRVRTYNTSDGLPSNEFGINGYWRSQSGLLYMVTAKGILCFAPDSLHEISLPPPVVVTGFMVRNESLPLSSNTFHLPPDAPFFSVEFAALHYRNPAQNTYAYKLEGLDKEWTYSGSRHFASYTNLDGGAYRLCLKACSSDGIWNEAGTTLHIIVHPPFWKRWQAVALFVMCVLGAVYYAYTLRIRTINQRNYELEVEVTKRTEELAEALREARAQKQRAEEANAFKTELLGIAAHDLKSPLQSIIGFASLLKEHPDAEVSRAAAVIERSSRNMVQLISDLLQSTEVDLGKVTLNRQPCYVERIAQTVVEQNVPQAKRKQQELIFSADNDCLVFADPARLAEIIDNLISNAIKYSPTGKRIWVSVRRKDSSPTVPAQARQADSTAPPPSIIVSVKDEGQGLTEEDMKKLFGKFQKLSAKPTGGEPSTGLGLSIVKQLVEMHGGRVWAESEGKHKGTTFSFELPASVPAPQHSITT